MKVLFVISPDYLSAVYKEAEGYNFFIQGYGDVEDAIKGLIKTNVSDILGFVYLASALPDNLNPLVDFMLKCNLLHSNKKFIFALQNTTYLYNIFNAYKFEFLRISYLPDIEVITDTVINKDIFGTILLDNYTPYKLKEEYTLSLSDFKYNKLQYIPLFPQNFFDCFSTVEVLQSIEQTKIYDKVYQSYLSYNPILAQIREAFIAREFGEVLDEQKLLDLIKDEKTNYCLYRSLIYSAINGVDYEVSVN